MGSILTNDFLIVSPCATTFHSLKPADDEIFFKKVYNTYFDNLTRSYTIKYKEGVKYSDINKNKSLIGIYSDNLIEDSILPMRLTRTFINGLEYYVQNQFNFINCHIYDGIEESVVYYNNSSILIMLKKSEVETWEINEYINFINSQKEIKVFIQDETKFKISNFSSVDLNKENRLNVDNSYIYNFEDIALSETDVISAFINELKTRHPEFIMGVELSDLFNKEQKKNLLFYKASLPILSDYSIRVREHPEFGRYIKTNIVVEFEYLSDDLQTFLHFRDLMFLGKEFVLDTSFIFNKINRDWSCGVVWDFHDEFVKDLTLKPNSKYFDNVELYNLKFKATIVCYLVEKQENPVKILFPIVRLWTDNSLVASMMFLDFDNLPQDKDIYRTVIPLSETKGIIIELLRESNNYFPYNVYSYDGTTRIEINKELFTPIYNDKGNLRKISFPTSLKNISIQKDIVIDNFSNPLVKSIFRNVFENAPIEAYLEQEKKRYKIVVDIDEIIRQVKKSIKRRD